MSNNFEQSGNPHWPVLGPAHRTRSATKDDRGGAKTRSRCDPAAGRQTWTDEEDAYLKANWHRMSSDAIAKALGRTFNSVNLRRKRIGIGRYAGDEFTIRELEDLTRIDHRQWHEFVRRGWLRVRERPRRHGAQPITYVSVPAIRTLLIKHPEIYDYRSAPKATRIALELDGLTVSPKLKRVVCRSEAWEDRVRVESTRMRRRVTHEATATAPQGLRLRSCAAEGGTRFWAPTYSLPVCPRCGCQVSRYSEQGVFTDLEVGDDEVIDVQARKLGLRWLHGELRDRHGQAVDDRDIIECLFSGSRRSAASIKAFEKLINAGMSLLQPKPIGRLLDNILSIKLRPDQEAALQAFAQTGAMTAAHATSFGKSTLGMMVLTRIGGRHLLMVDTKLLREQWVEKLAAAAPRVEVTRNHKPSSYVVRVLDVHGAERCTIDIYTYQSRAKLEGPWVVGCFDEVHRLPAARAHRHALAPTQYRIGLSATPDLRSDGRGALIAKMTGAMVGSDWAEQMASGVVPRISVKVLLVEDHEHKHEVVGKLLQQHDSVVVLCESIADGRELELRYGIPFVHGGTKDKLAVIRHARSLVLSRVGDGGISIPHCQVTVDHSGLFGSRIQSLQRLGRLMHSDRALFHCILMTRVERYERFAKRIDAIKAKGFAVVEEIAPREVATVHTLLTPALRARVSAQENPYLSMLGWRKDALIEAA